MSDVTLSASARNCRNVRHITVSEIQTSAMLSVSAATIIKHARLRSAQ